MVIGYVRCLFMVLALACLPLPSKAAPYQIAPNPNPTDGIITVSDADAMNDSLVEFKNYGVLNINPDPGMLTNSGTFTNGYLLENSGALINTSQGTLINESFGTLNNSGTLTNLGTLSNERELRNSQTLINHGNLINTANGTLTNRGYLENAGMLTNNGEVDNSGILEILGTLTNYRNLNNTGSVFNDGGIGGNGTYTQTAGSTIVNSVMSQAYINIQGGRLGGDGSITIGTPLLVGTGAIVTPGIVNGTLTVNGDLASRGNFVFEIGGGNGFNDVLDINGDAVFDGGAMQFDFINGFTASAGNNWDFLFANSITGWDSLLFSVNGLGTGLGWHFESINGGMRLEITDGGPAPVPEPSTILLLGSGLAGLAGFARKQIKR